MNIGLRSFHGFHALFIAIAAHGSSVIIALIVGCILPSCTSIGAYSGVNIPLSDIPPRSSGTVESTNELGNVYGLSTLMMFGDHVGLNINPQVRVSNGATSIHDVVVEDTFALEYDGAYTWKAINLELMFAASYFPLEHTSKWQPYTTVGLMVGVPGDVEAFGAPNVTMNTPETRSTPVAYVGFSFPMLTSGYVMIPGIYTYLTAQVGTQVDLTTWCRAGMDITINRVLGDPMLLYHRYRTPSFRWYTPPYVVSYLPAWTLGLSARIEVMF